VRRSFEEMGEREGKEKGEGKGKEEKKKGRIPDVTPAMAKGLVCNLVRMEQGGQDGKKKKKEGGRRTHLHATVSTEPTLSCLWPSFQQEGRREKKRKKRKSLVPRTKSRLLVVTAGG